MRNISDVLADIKTLVATKGYIYALCLIIIDDFHLNVEEIHEINEKERLNKNEALMLLGFLIQGKISTEIPNSPLDLIDLKKRTYVLMEELPSFH